MYAFYLDLPEERILPPISGLMEEILVNETSSGVFRVEFVPYNCLSGLPLFTLGPGSQVS